MTYKNMQTVITPITEVNINIETTGRRKQVGILGGNFNPVHYAHLMMADQVYTQLGLDEVYLMPSNIPPHKKNKGTISSEHRLNMLRMAVAEYPHIGIETIELSRDGKSYTFDTIQALKERNPDVDYYFIIGGDMVEDLPNWYRIEELLTLVKFVAVRRPNYVTETPYPLIWVEIPETSISSSLIREKIKISCSVNFMLPPDVLAYIEEEGLYRND